MYGYPPNLKKGDAVALVAPASFVKREALEYAKEVLEGWGLLVLEGKHLYAQYGQFAGTDKQRLEDLQWALDSQEVNALFCVRGGYGLSRIVDQVDLTHFCQKPKWVVGFSDVTHLHLKLQSVGMAALHAPMPAVYAHPRNAPALESLKGALFQNRIGFSFDASHFNRGTLVSGELVGGNLSILIDSLGTSNAPEFDGKVLFFEEVGEYHYAIDRMVVHLKRIGAFEMLKGVLVGYMSRLREHKTPFGKLVQEIVLEAVSEYDLPVFFGVPAGHEDHNMPLVLGGKCSVKVSGKSVLFTQSLEKAT